MATKSGQRQARGQHGAAGCPEALEARADRVDRLRAEVRSGLYNVDTGKVAWALIAGTSERLALGMASSRLEG